MLRFPALKLARQAMQSGGIAPTILNAANEIAVAAFLNQQIRFTQIPQVVEHVLNQMDNQPAHDLDAILQADQMARGVSQQYVVSKGS
jgi:1-deoxy-D-xylulose-5-phosphate reductoisomerase